MTSKEKQNHLSHSRSETSADRSAKTTPERKDPINRYVDDKVLRKKKKGLSLKDVRKDKYSYNEFVPRASLLD